MSNTAENMTSAPEKLLTRDFPLRPDLIVRMTLPVVLTTEDAERLAGFVRSLVFVPEGRENHPCSSPT